MRTLHVATSRTWRGGEQQVLYLVDGLQRRGLGPVLATPARSPLARKARDRGVAVVPFLARGDLDLIAVRELRKLLRSGFEVLHLHTARAHAVGLLAAWGLPGRPRVVVSRRVDFPPRGGLFGRLKYRREVDRFVAVSHAVEHVLVRGGVDRRRVVTVHSGVDPSRFQVPRDGEGLRRELGVAPDVQLVGFVGALVPHKAPADFVEALARVPKTVHGLLVGAGPLADDLRRRARKRGVAGRAHFLGHREDIPRILRSLDVFCLPSHLEGLGTSILDAMAAETPVVAATGGGIGEMVENEGSGLLVAPGDVAALARAWIRVLEDPALASRLAAGGRKRVQAFTADRMVEGMLAVYQELLGTGNA